MSFMRLVAAGFWLLIAAFVTGFVLTTNLDGWLFWVLVLVAFFYSRVPNWWPGSGALYAVATALVGLVPTCLLMSVTPFRSPGEALSSISEWLFIVVLVAAVILSWLAAKFYMALERLTDSDHFAKTFPGENVWRFGWEDIFPIGAGIILWPLWSILVLSRPFAETSFGERAFFALLFAWIAVWLGKLLMTIQARYDRQREHPRYNSGYLGCLKHGEQWPGDSGSSQ